jgi:hypothetical protein
MTEKPRNAMQAVLDRAAQKESAEPVPPPTLSTPKPRRTSRASAPVEEKSFVRPSRRNTRLIGGHFKPELAKQLRILAAEEDTTIQALLEEAIDLLLAKKAKCRIGVSSLLRGGVEEPTGIGS